VRADGAYWGAAGEQIDLLSGNLNYTVPLLKALSRTGWGVGFALSYNSQIWRQDAGGTWKLGRDVGYGLGWKLMAGSIRPVYEGVWNLHHYVFTDSSGAEFRLDVNSNNVWTSREAFHGSFDGNASSLYFPDGSRWAMSAQSAGWEEDAGTLYPTAFHDTNGNRIEVTYKTGAGAAGANTSARIERIDDSRRLDTYLFTYNSDRIPHLANISNTVGTAERYTFTYAGGQSLISPFGGEVFGTTVLLQSVATTDLGAATTFDYQASSRELVKMTTPLGGNIGWGYRTYSYSGGRRYREVATRWAHTGAASQTAAWNWTITLDSHPTLHASAIVGDQDTGTQDPEGLMPCGDIPGENSGQLTGRIPEPGSAKITRANVCEPLGLDWQRGWNSPRNAAADTRRNSDRSRRS
jgi:hypothetical protein